MKSNDCLWCKAGAGIRVRSPSSKLGDVYKRQSGGAGGLIGTALQILPMFLKKGGLTSHPSAVNAGAGMNPAMFRNAPSFADGTGNTSGIPAILHENEAVIPLDGNRKIPVEFDGPADGGGNRVVNVTQNFNFPNSDADSFRRSQGQVAAEAAMTANAALSSNGWISRSAYPLPILKHSG